jgi:hypothetical protein
MLSSLMFNEYKGPLREPWKLEREPLVCMIAVGGDNESITERACRREVSAVEWWLKVVVERKRMGVKRPK